MENQENGQTDDRITKFKSVGSNPLRVEEIDEVREDQLSGLNTPSPPESPLHELHEYALLPNLPGTSLHDGFVSVYIDDLDPAQPCTVVEETTGSSGSENSAIGAEPSESTPSLQLSIGLRSVGPEQQSPTITPSNLPDSLAGELTPQKVRESASTGKTESSPTTDSPNASPQQVLFLVSSSTSGDTLCFLPQPVLHIQAPSLEPIAECLPSLLTLRVEPTPQLVCTLVHARSQCSRACKRRSVSATHHPDHRPKNRRDGPQV